MRGKYDREIIIKALRRLDRVIKEKSGKSNFLVDEENAFEYDHYQEIEDFLMNSEDDDPYKVIWIRFTPSRR